MVLWLWFMILPRGMATQDHVHYEIMFHEESLIKFTTEYWLHTYVIDLPKINKLSTLPFCEGSGKRCSTKNIITANVNMLRQNILHTVNETKGLNDDLIPNTNTSKSKRALFPWLGSIIHDITGTNNELSQVNNHIKNLQKAIKRITSVMSQQDSDFSSYVKLIDTFFQI
jgi:hypothetical protein